MQFRELVVVLGSLASINAQDQTANFLNQLTSQGWLSQGNCGALRRSNEAASTPGYFNKCNTDNELVAISFYYKRDNETDLLRGTIPPLSLVPNLEYVSFFGNGITGTVPSFSANQKLKRIDFADNALEGTIPSLFGLSNLEYISLYGNKLSGIVPDLDGLPNLKVASFAYNSLTGTVPALNSDLRPAQLEYLSLFANKLTGTIPEVKGLPLLQKLKLYDNDFTGTIPQLNTTRLSIVSLGENRLSGPIPTLQGLGSTLQKLLVRQNSLSGGFPELGNLQYLTTLDVTDNQLTNTAGDGQFDTICPPLLFAPNCPGNGTSYYHRNTDVGICNCKGQATQITCELNGNPWLEVGLAYLDGANSTCGGATNRPADEVVATTVTA